MPLFDLSIMQPDEFTKRVYILLYNTSQITNTTTPQRKRIKKEKRGEAELIIAGDPKSNHPFK